MDPTFTTGDVLVVAPWVEPGVGDIAQFTVPLAPGQAETTASVAHRIVGRDERGFITRGDNPRAEPDYWRVSPDMVTGTVVAAWPQVWMFRIAAVLAGFAVLVVLWPARGTGRRASRRRRAADRRRSTQASKSVRPHQSSSPPTPGGQAKSADPVWRMYSLSASSEARRFWTGTNDVRGSRM